MKNLVYKIEMMSLINIRCKCSKSGKMSINKQKKVQLQNYDVTGAVPAAALRVGN